MLFQKTLLHRIETLDVAAAKADVIHFIKDPHVLEIWSKTVF